LAAITSAATHFERVYRDSTERSSDMVELATAVGRPSRAKWTM
jgi:hypothetical protein